MAFTNYSDITAALSGAGTAAGTPAIYASSLSVENSLNFSPVRVLGLAKPAGMVPDGPIRGSVSLEMVGGAAGFLPTTDMLSNGLKTIVTAGGESLEGYVESFSISMAPNEVVQASLGLTAFQELKLPSGDGGSAVEGSSSIFTGGHGAGTGGTTGLTSAEFNFSAGWDAIYFIGSMCPEHIYCTEGSAEATVEGPNISESVGFDCEDPCPEANTTVSFEIGSLCGASAGSYSVTGYATGSGMSVSEGGVLSGSQTAIEFLL